MSWLDIGALEDVPVRGARKVKTHFGCIGVFRTAEEEVFAVQNECPHKGGPLSEGIVHDQKITCPLHNWVFDLNTGMAQDLDEGQIATYAVKIEGGRIMLETSALVQKAA